MSVKISVAIPTMGRETLRYTLDSLARQTEKAHEILIVNQGPQEVEQTWEIPERARWCHQDAKGLSRARNRALKEFSGDWVLFTDDDQEVNAEWVEQARRLIEAYPQIDILGGVVFTPPAYDAKKEFVSECYAIGNTIIDKSNYLVHTGVSHVLNDIWGGNFAISRKCVDKVGLYDEAFGRGSKVFDVGEDTDYVTRVISAGLVGLLSCRLIIYHTYGARPYSDAMSTDNIEVAAALNWKASKSGGNVDPDIASRLQSFGKKKALVAKMTGGRLFEDSAKSKKVYDETMAKLERDWTVENGILKPR